MICQDGSIAYDTHFLEEILIRKGILDLGLNF